MSGVSWSIAGYIADVPISDDPRANVWRGEVADTGEVIALKRILLDPGDDRRAARVEAALLATLKHPHLVRLREVLPSLDGIVLVLDYAGGGSLAELLQRRGRLSPGEVVTTIAPVGAALAYAHGSGVVHGRVSAGTILFTELGLPMLADLGISRLVGDIARRGLTAACVDPSVDRGAAPGPESDVFMLAATAYHALSGVVLCPGDSADLTHVDPLLLGLGVPVAMRDVLRRGLSIEASRRGTAAEFALDLRYAAEPTAVELTAGYLDVGRPAPPLLRATLADAIMARPPAAAPVQVGPPKVGQPVQQVHSSGSSEDRKAPLVAPPPGEPATARKDGAATRPATAAGGHRLRAAGRSVPLTDIGGRIRWPRRPVR
ncbi:MAG: protein kinase, partial [Actinomycetota bacterium]|nr:protein kinase [Actinomycetota bacterium]